MRPAMGTLVHVRAAGPDAIAAQQAVEAALDSVERIERLMSFHDPHSELSRLNREAVRTPQTVHPWTWSVLRRALRVAEASDGLFDITVAPLLAFPEVDWAIHGFHTFLHQPVFGYIKEHICSSLIIDTFKKANATYRSIISLILIFFVDKCGNAANKVSSSIF